MMIMLLSQVARAFSPDLQYYRGLLERSQQSSRSARAFYDQTRRIQDTGHPTLLGYKAMSELMMCPHVSGPFNKLGYFNRGRKMLEQAIGKDRNNAELRFMRFCIQNNVPAILNYSGDLDADKEFLISYLKRAGAKDAGLHELIRAY
ncbi:MAG: hypothetical protein JNL13_05940, partial [Chitinophagaceae bacterium]|nr:hypothetical protein [Chitinophagaceae bacterium]